MTGARMQPSSRRRKAELTRFKPKQPCPLSGKIGSQETSAPGKPRGPAIVRNGPNPDRAGEGVTTACADRRLSLAQSISTPGIMAGRAATPA